MQAIKGDENSEVVLGDLAYDGRVILYIIKGSFLSVCTIISLHCIH